tara:strand:- start:9792 stop:10166 length:375 start_codon:yes stop_codon:yes gene_type:complete
MKYGIDEALAALVPTGTWTILNEVYSGITWHDTSFTKPTESEVNAKITELNNAEPMRLLRIERDIRLQETDWTVLSDAQLSADKVTEYKTYRQALRDLPSTASPALTELYELNDASVTYPTKPS